MSDQVRSRGTTEENESMGRYARMAATVIVCLFMAGFDLVNVEPRLETRQLRPPVLP